MRGTVVVSLLVGTLAAPSVQAALSIRSVATGGIALASDGTVWMLGQVPAQVSGLTGVVAIAGCIRDCLAVKVDGTVWSWNGGVPTPAQVKGLSGVVAVASGGNGGLALKADGTVWEWGAAYYDAAHGSITSHETPVQVAGLSGATGIAAGQAHSLVVKSDGTVWAWGNNAYGQLGDGTIGSLGSATPAPVQVTGLTEVVTVAAGYGHSLALKRDGTVWGWGHNGGGQLGDGTIMNVRLTPVQASGLTRVTAIAAGDFGSLAIEKDAVVWQWGVLGDGTYQSTPIPWSTLTGVAVVAGSPSRGLVLKSDGTLWGWGGGWGADAGGMRPAPGQVSGLSEVTAVDANGLGGLALKGDGSVWKWGNASPPLPVSGLSGVTAIAAFMGHNMALESDGTVWEWSGESAPSQVSGLTGVTAIAAGETRSLAVKGDGTVWQWTGQQVAGSRNPAVQTPPALVGGLSGVVAVSVAWEDWWYSGVLRIPSVRVRSVALKSDGTVWVWDQKDWGSSSSVPAQISGLTGIVAIAARAHGVALKSDGTVWEWDTRPTPVTPAQVVGLSGAVAVATGIDEVPYDVAYSETAYGLALKSDGTVWAWGDNEHGQLGDGTTMYRALPVQVGGIRDVAAIAPAGTPVSSAIKRDGTLWSWGSNTFGLLGLGIRPAVPVQLASPGSPDLAIAMRHDRDFTVGGQSVYTLTISNVGRLATTGPVTVTDILPPGLNYVSAVGNGWSCSMADEIVTCTNAAPIDAGSSGTIVLSTAVGPRAWPGVTNLAIVSNASDANMANNTIGDPALVLQEH